MRQMFCPHCQVSIDIFDKKPRPHCFDCGSALQPDTGNRLNSKRIADRIDGYDRDDLGESPDF